MFSDKIKTAVDGVRGGIGGVVMGMDGIAVESYIAERKVDVTTIGMEFSYILNQVRKAGEVLEIGALEEVVIRAEQLTFLVRMLTKDYFLAVVVRSDANLGRARFMMRLVAPPLTAEL